MVLSKRDREFRLPKVSYLHFKHLEMDRVLTAFFARLAHNGFPSRLQRKAELTTEAFVEEFLEHPEWFSGFQSHRDILGRWIETHLMDVVNRGKANQAIAAPRPLHGFTYRFRNPKHSRDYGAAQHLYEMLYGARNGAGQKALEHLDHFFFQAVRRIRGGAAAHGMVHLMGQYRCQHGDGPGRLGLVDGDAVYVPGIPPVDPLREGAPHDLGTPVGDGTAKLGAPIVYVMHPEQFQGAEDAPFSAIMHGPASEDVPRDQRWPI